MLCSSCKKEIPDNSSFCLNCGNRITNSSAKPVIYDYEYTDFSYEIGDTYEKVGILRIREIPEDTWRDYQAKLLPEIKKWEDQGWEPISEIGPSGFKIHEEPLGCMTMLFDSSTYNAQRKVHVSRFVVKMRRRKSEQSSIVV